MLLDIKKFLKGIDLPLSLHGKASASCMDFPGFSLYSEPDYDINICLQGEKLVLDIEIKAEILAECARCLSEVKEKHIVVATYAITANDLNNEEFDLSFTTAGKLDIDELVSQELLLKLPLVFLCQEDCEGLCPACGTHQKNCGCDKETQDIDPRWDVLRKLLED